MKNRTQFSCLAAGILVIAAVCPAADIRVPSQQASIAAALTAAAGASGPDTIIIENAGPFTEILVLDSDVTITGDTGITPVIMIPNGGPSITMAASVTVTLDGLVIDGSNNIVASAIDSLIIGDGVDITVDNCEFLNASARHINIAGGLLDVTALIEDSTFTTSGDRGVEFDGIDGTANSITIQNCIIQDAFDDLLQIEIADGVATIQNNIFDTVTDPGAEGIQVGMDGTIIIDGNLIMGALDEGIQLDGTGDYTITNNTIFECSTGLRFDTGAVGTCSVTHNIVAEWDESVNGGDPDEGFALSNPNSLVITEDYNLLVDSTTSLAFRFNFSGSNTIEIADVVSVFCSTNPADAEFLAIREDGPAFEIDGPTNAGADNGTCTGVTAGAAGWDLYQ